MLAFEKQATVNLVRQNQNIAIPDNTGQLLNLFALHHAPGGIVRRIQNNQPGAAGNETCEFVYIDREIPLLAQVDWYRSATNIVNHRLINREAWVGINDLISFINQSQHREENDWLPSWNDDHFFGRSLNPASATHIVGDGLPQVG